MATVPDCKCPECRLEELKGSGCDCEGCKNDEEEINKEIEKMSDTAHPYKVGDKATIVNKQWNEGKGLPDPKGAFKVLAVHGDEGNQKVFLGLPRDCGVGGYCEEQSQVPKKFHGKFNGSWVSIEDVEKSEMKEKLMTSGKEMGVAATKGVKLALASQGAEFAYQRLSQLAQSHLGLTNEQMESPVVKEGIKTLTPVIIHLAATMSEGTIPHVEKVKVGCELLIQDQTRAHAVTLMQVFGPMLGEMASMMDPAALQQQIFAGATAPPAQGRIEVPAAPVVDEDAQAEAEQEAEEGTEEKARATA